MAFIHNDGSNRFMDYTTSIGFSLTLTKLQIQVINSLAAAERSEWLLAPAQNYSMLSLFNKGMIDKGEVDYVLSKAGKLMLPVLDCAGLLEPGQKLRFGTIRRQLEKLDKSRDRD